MRAEEFIAKVKLIVGEINFDGHVNKVIGSLSEECQNHMLVWIQDCKDGRAIPQPCKNYRNLVSFIYKSNDNRVRGILTKEKNAYFIELFLDKHKYYDNKRKYPGL